MMRCPSCRVDFGPSYVTCPYCGAQLVDAGTSESQRVELVPVFFHEDRAVVAIVKSMLESAGILVVARSLGILTSAELLVPVEDAEDARMLLHEASEEGGPGGAG